MSWKLLPTFRQITWFCYLCFYGRQANKPARPIGRLGSGERKYCLFGAAKVLWKNFEPFWRNVTSKIVFWCMYLSIYCYERLFAVTDVSMNANRTNERGQFADYVQMKGNIVNFRQEIYCEKISSRFWEIYHLIECHISLWPDFALSSVFFSLCCYERQTDKPARPIGWLSSCERKHCLLCREKGSWKNVEPF